MLKWILITPLIFLLDYLRGLSSSDFRELYIDNMDRFEEEYIKMRRRKQNAR